MKEQLKKYNVIIDAHRVNPAYNKLIKKYKIESDIIQYTNFLDPTAMMRERIYAIMSDLTAVPICSHPDCNNPVKFIKDGVYRNQYSPHCSLYCSNNNPLVKDRKEKSNIKNNGVANPSQSSAIKAKKIQTCNSNFGTDFPQQSEQVRTKSRQKSIEKYGTDNNFKRKEIRNKTLEAKRTITESTDYYKKLYAPGWLKKQNREKTLTQIASELDVSLSTVCRAIKNQGLETVHHFSSYSQQLLVDHLQTFFNGEILTNIRTIIPPYELDIVIPSLNLAIEFDGLYWHSEDGTAQSKTDKNYHLNKTRLCEEKGIQLIHIFENEWIYKPEITLSRLRNIFHCNEHQIGGRKTQVTELNNKIVSKFLEENHIQGKCQSKINYGLVFNGEIVSVMTFGNPRFSKKYEWELIRFCNKKNTSVIGGASKLFKHFQQGHQPKNVVSYADRRWSQGNLYEKLGFDFYHNSAPNYFYVAYDRETSATVLHNRIKFQKHKLKDKLEVFDPGLTESQNMFNNGYRRIWDCGNSVWVWERNLR